jgi:phage replication O-like protein O
MSHRFSGFRSPNYTQVPDELFDELLATLSLAELKVLLYVMRRTFGFKKGSDRISKSQLENGITKRLTGEILDRGTGLSRRAIRLAIQSLIAKNILLKRTHRSRERGDESTEYALNIIGNRPWVPSTPGGGKRSTPGEGIQVPPQETVNNKQSYTRGSKPLKEKPDSSHRELVAYFHRKAGHPEVVTPAPKELDQAKTLLTTYPEPIARFIVDFALQRARETNFRVRYFGAVLGYVAEALEHHARAQVRTRRDEANRRRMQEEELAFRNAPRNLNGLLMLKISRFKLNKGREPSADEIEVMRREFYSTESADGR